MVFFLGLKQGLEKIFSKQEDEKVGLLYLLLIDKKFLFKLY